MKRLLAIAAITAALTACGGEAEDATSEKQYTSDTTQTSADFSMGDTTDLSGPKGDSTSASGIHGAGSGSRVGGGVSGGAQGKSSDSTKKK
ncbi:MAG: hypothetical protein JWQ40_4883 [Segetibacter sp.]|jgi:outer membrane lipoprotein SlyB|nr:hypothetical protein [Segetibacter sp.]